QEQALRRRTVCGRVIVAPTADHNHAVVQLEPFQLDRGMSLARLKAQQSHRVAIVGVPGYLGVLPPNHVKDALEKRLGRDGQAAGAHALKLEGHGVRLGGHQPDAEVNGNYRAPGILAVAEAQADAFRLDGDARVTNSLGKDLFADAALEEVLDKITV